MKGLNGPLRVLTYLYSVNEPVTLLRISQEAKMNYRTVQNAIKLLKELGFIEENLDPGPPIRRMVKLTEKGREAASHARRLLELAGLI